MVAFLGDRQPSELTDEEQVEFQGIQAELETIKFNDALSALSDDDQITAGILNVEKIALLNGASPCDLDTETLAALKVIDDQLNALFGKKIRRGGRGGCAQLTAEEFQVTKSSRSCNN